MLLYRLRDPSCRNRTRQTDSAGDPDDADPIPIATATLSLPRVGRADSSSSSIDRSARRLWSAASIIGTESTSATVEAMSTSVRTSEVVRAPANSTGVVGGRPAHRDGGSFAAT
ncbi:hypothetical protein P9139_13650 [Curtobacterium flaccumfaciens]|nr:hypothetical protein P9139_13650 [Curtobacterium flaccumfaciens]